MNYDPPWRIELKTERRYMTSLFKKYSRTFFFASACSGLLSLLLLLCSSCHHANEPDQSGGKRDYTWTLDTISNAKSPDLQTDMSTIWASSPQDVYVGGFSSLYSIGVLYHYDGNRWTEIHLHVSEGGNISGGFQLESIYGFGSNNVWAVGMKGFDNPTPPPSILDSSFIIHYDGASWTEAAIERGRGLAVVWGISSSDIWAGGGEASAGHGTLYHYDGAAWSKLPFDTSVFVDDMAGFGSNDVYATCVKNTVPPDSGRIYLASLRHWDGSAWSIIDSFYFDQLWNFGLRLWAGENHTLYSSTYGVYRYGSGTTWTKLLSNEYPLVVRGSSSDNIFAVGSNGRIFEWNGTDWKRFTEIEHPQITWYGVWTNNVETFIVGNDNLKTYILHGK
jgi:hypothetical protein